MWRRGAQGQDPAVSRVRAAAEEISALRAMRFSGKTTFSDRPDPATNVGVKDLTTGTAHQFLTEDGTTTEAVIRGDVAYLRLDPATAAAVGKSWVARRHAASRLDMLVGLETAATVAACANSVTDRGLTSTDEGELSRFRAAFTPKRAGGEPYVRQLCEVMKQLQADTVTLDLFLDGAGRLRRYRVCWPDAVTQAPDGRYSGMVLTREYHDFEVVPAIAVPAAADVLMQAGMPPDLKKFPVVRA